MTNIFISQLAIVLPICFIAFSCMELLCIKYATIDKEELDKHKDKDGFVPMPHLLTKWTEEEFYEKYETSANLLSFLINVGFVIMTIYCLYFMNYTEYSVPAIDLRFLFVLFIMLLFFNILAIQKLFLIKNKGIENLLNNNKKVDYNFVKLYAKFTQVISNTSDLKVCNSILWTQFFFNKFVTTMVIILLFIVRIIVCLVS